MDRLQSRLAEARRLLASAFGHRVEAAPAARANRETLTRLAGGGPGGTVDAGGIEASGPPSADDLEFIAEHLAEGRVYLKYGFGDKARAEFETVLARFPDNSEALGDLHSRTYGIPSIRLEHIQPHPALIDLIPPETARRHRVLPLAATTTLTIAVTDPAYRLSIDAISAMTGCKVEPVVASESALDRAIDRYYGPIRSPGDEVRGSALRLAWSRRSKPRGDGGGPEGDLPAA